jgi:hypothetical protein
VELVLIFDGSEQVVGNYSESSVDPGSIGVGTLGGAQAVFDEVQVTVLE